MTIWDAFLLVIQKFVDAMVECSIYGGISIWDIVVGFFALWDFKLILGDLFGSTEEEDEEGPDDL